MSVLKILKQKRADLNAESLAIVNKAEAEKRGFTETEASRLDAIESEMDATNADILRAEKAQERVRALGDVSTREDDNAAADRKAADGRQPDNKTKFNSLGEQMRAIMSAGTPGGDVDPRLQAEGMRAGPTGMSEGIAADGGYLVQSDFIGDIMRDTFEGGEIASRIRKITVGPNSNGIKANGVDETSRAEGQRWGGVRAFWTQEAGLKRESRPKFTNLSMELQKLVGLCYVTDELLQDTTALSGWLGQAFKEEFTFKIEDAILNGNGSGMPLGVFNSPAVITVQPLPGQPARTINSANIVDMWTRMSPKSRQNAVWIINSEAEAQLYTLMMLVKNVAGTENVGGLPMPEVKYTPPGTAGNTNGTLMGKPVIPVEYCAPLGVAGDIALVDLSQYLGIDKGGIQEASSIHVRFIYDETVFRWVYRFNGQPITNKPILPYRGNQTRSPFIVLGNR